MGSKGIHATGQNLSALPRQRPPHWSSLPPPPPAAAALLPLLDWWTTFWAPVTILSTLHVYPLSSSSPTNRPGLHLIGEETGGEKVILSNITQPPKVDVGVFLTPGPSDSKVFPSLHIPWVYIPHVHFGIFQASYSSLKIYALYFPSSGHRGQFLLWQINCYKCLKRSECILIFPF